LCRTLKKGSLSTAETEPAHANWIEICVFFEEAFSSEPIWLGRPGFVTDDAINVRHEYGSYIAAKDSVPSIELRSSAPEGKKYPL
jgi:hypothetical protein